jgi:hypothetical protein
VVGSRVACPGCNYGFRIPQEAPRPSAQAAGLGPAGQPAIPSTPARGSKLAGSPSPPPLPVAVRTGTTLLPRRFIARPAWYAGISVLAVLMVTSTALLLRSRGQPKASPVSRASSRAEPSKSPPPQAEPRDSRGPTTTAPEIRKQPTKWPKYNTIYGLAFNRDGLLAVASAYAIGVWDGRTGRHLSHIRAYARCAAFSPDGRMAAFSSVAGEIHVIEIPVSEFRKLLGSGRNTSTACLTFSHDGKYILSGAYDGAVRAWDVGSGRILHTLAGPEGTVYSVAMVPGGDIVLSTNNSTVYIWDVKRESELAKLKGHNSMIREIKLLPDGVTLASIDSGGTIRTWDVNARKPLRSSSVKAGWAAARFSEDGNLLAIDSNARSTRIVQVSLGTELRTIPSGGRSIAFSPNGTRVATGGSDGSVNVWEVDTGTHVCCLQWPENL